LFTLFGDDGELDEIAVDEWVEIAMTLRGGRTMTLRPTAIGRGWGLMRGVEQVETVGPKLGHILWVGRWPSECTWLACHLRGLLLNELDDCSRAFVVAARHPRQSPGWHAREEREATLRRMDRNE
jgi:hypothetical protein